MRKMALEGAPMGACYLAERSMKTVSRIRHVVERAEILRARNNKN